MRVRSTKKAIAKDVARKFSFFRLSVESTAVRILKKFTTRFMPQHLFNDRPDVALRGTSRKNVKFLPPRLRRFWRYDARNLPTATGGHNSAQAQSPVRQCRARRYPSQQA